MTAKIQKMNPSNCSRQGKGEGGDGWKRVSKATRRTFLVNSQESHWKSASPMYRRYEISNSGWNSEKKGDVTCLT